MTAVAQANKTRDESPSSSDNSDGADEQDLDESSSSSDNGGGAGGYDLYESGPTGDHGGRADGHDSDQLVPLSHDGESEGVQGDDKIPSRPGQSTNDSADVDNSELALRGAVSDEEDDDQEQEYNVLDGNDHRAATHGSGGGIEENIILPRDGSDNMVVVDNDEFRFCNYIFMCIRMMGTRG